MQRLFFGFEIVAPWPERLPQGRLIPERERHLTLSFLGRVDESALLSAIGSIPPPPFKIGPVGLCDRLLLLPEETPRVAAWHIDWKEKNRAILDYHIQLLNWLEHLNYSVDRRPLLSHLSIARAPFQREEWETAFTPLPCLIKALHLYESVGNLHYPARWSYPLLPAFEELSHTADLAFRIHGSTLDELFLHACTALAFHFPAFLSYCEKSPFHHWTDLVRALNQAIARADQVEGCPFKAVSYHGNRTETYWEMIVDV